MSSKKNKNKNKSNKPVNPLPPQKVESEISENIEKTLEEIQDVATAPEERVPEIISEIVTAIQPKETESDTPKKPKRNRGKKKKTDKEDSDDKIEPCVPEPVKEDIKTEVEIKKDVVEVTPAIEVPDVAPAARKKKNKNKKPNEPAIQELKGSEEVVTAEETPIEIKPDNLPQISEQTLEQQDVESKGGKKKNKKKKRNDSEKSEKTEEALSCTSAFQKILEPKQESNLIKEDIKKDTIQTDDKRATVKETELIKNKEKDQDILKTENIVSEALTDTQQAEKKTDKEHNKEIDDTPKDGGGKDKKKNKKDKKHPSKAESDQLKNIESTADVKIDEQAGEKSENMSSVSADEFASVGKLEIDAQEGEKSPKPKAKIAKPVEKNKKGKSQTVPEKMTENESIQSQEITKLSEGLLPGTSQEPPKTLKHETKSDNVIELPTETLEKDCLIEEHPDDNSDFIQVPKGGMGKKDKKTPKPSKIKEKLQSNPEEIMVTESSDKSASLAAVPQEISVSKPESTFKISHSDPLISSEAGVTVSAEALQLELDSPDTLKSVQRGELEQQIHKTEQIQTPEKPKKRKKSPKPKKHDVTPDNQKPLSSSVPLDFSDNVKIEILPKIPLRDDIEIQSMKTDESEGSICDISPDIQFPRSSSQLPDDNNNTIIQEITSQDTKLFVPVVLPDTPLVEHSADSLRTPELIPLMPTEETTDLKSKVLEVNQDMEELKLSIEKSLAELTAMETSEQDTDKKIDEARAKIDEIREIVTPTSSESQASVIECQLEKPKIDTNIPMSTAARSQVVIPEEVERHEVIAPVKGECTLNLAAEEQKPEAPLCPARKDHKGRGKNKKKGKQEGVSDQSVCASSTTTSTQSTAVSKPKDKGNKDNKDEKSEQKNEQSSQEKGKQQSTDFETAPIEENIDIHNDNSPTDFEPIESFEDALTSSIDDVNKTFEMIANEVNLNTDQSVNNPEINIIAPIEDDEKDETKQKQVKTNPVSQPKNLLGHPDIPVQSNKTDYKKEKNKIPNNRQAKVKIKDSVPIEAKESKESQTETKQKLTKRKSLDESLCVTNENDEFVYKYSFRKVYLPSSCHVCKKELKFGRVPCNFCNLIFYCNLKHKDEDWSQHQGLCFAVSSIAHLKDQKYIYADAKHVTGQNYRIYRMQMILSCEKVLKRRLVPWEQEVLLYPRICADVGCREWRQSRLMDCEACGQIAYCIEHPEHLLPAHSRWCKSYGLYQKLVTYQQTKGRLEPKLPSRVMVDTYQMAEKLNEVLANMYEEKIDMNDIQYAALTQIATAPLTAAYCFQLYNNKMNSIYANGVNKKSFFTIHVVGAELQFEADALNKWELFFLHLRPDLKELRVTLVGPALNPANLPFDLLKKIKPCENCRQNSRRVVFDFHDKMYNEYWSTDFITPDLVCSFNPSIQRASIYNGKDYWPSTLDCILKLKVPFLVTSYTMDEIHRDLIRIKEVSENNLNVISEPKYNNFASVRPDRNFISDDEIPLLFKNYCFMVVCGAF